jgi:hypothetical protein
MKMLAMFNIHWHSLYYICDFRNNVHSIFRLTNISFGFYCLQQWVLIFFDCCSLNYSLLLSFTFLLQTFFAKSSVIYYVFLNQNITVIFVFPSTKLYGLFFCITTLFQYDINTFCHFSVALCHFHFLRLWNEHFLKSHSS